jgi:hypothetical protein
VLENSGHKRVPAYIKIGQQVMEEYAKKANGIAQNIILEVMFDRPTTAHILAMAEYAMSKIPDKNKNMNK